MSDTQLNPREKLEADQKKYMEEVINKVHKKGTYYNPAWTHHSNKKIKVTCDRCKKPNIKSCIGYADFDVCMKCIDDIDHKKGYIMDPPPITTFHYELGDPVSEFGFWWTYK